MFEKLSRAAEILATNVSESRRGFLGRMAQGALGVAGVLGCLLVLPKDAQAQTGVNCCQYQCRGTGVYSKNWRQLVCYGSNACPLTVSLSSVYGNYYCELKGQKVTANCDSCVRTRY